MQQVGETGGDWSLSQAWQQMSTLLTQLDSHVLERKLRLCQAALRPGAGGAPADCEEQVKLDLRHFEAAGSVTFNLCCLHCSGGSGRDRDRCQACQGSGRSAPVVLDLVPYQHQATLDADEVQLIARYLTMVVFRGGQGALEGSGEATLAALQCEPLQVGGEAHDQLQVLEEAHDHLQVLEEAHDHMQLLEEAHDQLQVLEEAHDQLQVLEEAHGQLHSRELERQMEALRARYEQQDAELVRREEAELVRRQAARGGAEDDEEDDDDSEGCNFDDPPVLTLDMQSLTRYGPGQQTRARNALLAPEFLRPVRKLTKMHCEFDPDWALQLLCDVSSRVEELQVRTPAREHLEVIEDMRRLTRLDVEFYSEGGRRRARRRQDLGQDTSGPDLDEYIFRRPRDGAGHRGLRWLRVGHMPKLTTFSLLRAHRHTLEEVWLMVGSWHPDQGQQGQDRWQQEQDARWPFSCRDLHLQLTRGGATWPRLRSVVLFRWLNVHDRLTCLEQSMAVEAVLPDARVRCHECSGESFLAF